MDAGRAGGGDLPALDELARLLARLPGMGPRSARRAVLAMLKQKDSLMRPMAAALTAAAEAVAPCAQCGNLDVRNPCAICADPRRDATRLCVVEEVDDLWALERARVYRGRYHVLGGALSAIDGRGPEALGVDRLIARAAAGRQDARAQGDARAQDGGGDGGDGGGDRSGGDGGGGDGGGGDRVSEVILALSATVDGQTTAHYLADRLRAAGVPVSALAQGVPIGGALGWLDDGTIAAALAARRTL